MRISDYIFCEDIRTEIGNKHSIMGVLNDALNFSGEEKDLWPKQVNLAIFIRIAEIKRYIENIEFSLEVTLEGKKVAEINSSATIKAETKIINIPIVMHGFPLQAAGKYIFNFTVKDKDEVLIEDAKTLVIS